MSKVITFSTVFPSYHPKKGQPTYFVEKFLASCADCIEGFQIPEELEAYDFHVYYNSIGKHHTIREGSRFTVGEKFSPRIWSGKPYNSKQIIISPDTEIKKIFDFEMDENGVYSINGKYINEKTYPILAKNDGLNELEMHAWFMPNFNKPKPFKGQIICWNDKINY